MVFALLRQGVESWRIRRATQRWEREQNALKARLVEADDFAWCVHPQDGKACLKRVGGLDISFFSDGGHPDDDRACVALIVCEFDEARETMEVVWKDFKFIRMTEPYIAGYLAFREAPHYCAMLRRLQEARPDLVPEVILVDGNGVLHYRGFGVASHVGVLSGQCTIGVAKNLLMVDGLERGVIRDRCAETPSKPVPLVGDSGRVWGAAVLPRPRKPLSKASPPSKNPIYISVGHRVGLDSCSEIVRLCLLSARVPEPVRLADVLSREQVRMVVEQEEKKTSGLAGHWLLPSGRGKLLPPSVAALAVLGVAGALAAWRWRGRPSLLR